jgi:hypothetical protein
MLRNYWSGGGGVASPTPITTKTMKSTKTIAKAYIAIIFQGLIFEDNLSDFLFGLPLPRQ